MINRKFLYPLLVLFLLCALPLTGTDFDQKQFTRKLYLHGQIPAGTIARTELPLELLPELAENYGNARVYSQSGSELPFVIRIISEKQSYQQRETASLEILSFREDTSSNQAELIVAFPLTVPTRPVESLTLLTRARDFDKTIQIATAASVDGPWQMECPDGRFFDYSSKIDLRNNNFALSSPSSNRFYKITICNYQEDAPSPLWEVLTSGDQVSVERQEFRKKLPRIDQVLATALTDQWQEKPLLQLNAKVPIKKLEIPPDSISSSFSIPVNGHFVSQIHIASSNKICERKIEFSSQNQERIQFLTETRFVQIPEKTTGNRIDLPRTTKIELLNGFIFDYDNAPLENVVISLYGPRFEIFIQCDHAVTDPVLYVGGTIPPPRYDLSATLSGLLADASPIELTLGDLELLSNSAPLSASYGKILFYVAIPLAAVMLGIVLFKSLKNVPENESPGE